MATKNWIDYYQELLKTDGDTPELNEFDNWSDTYTGLPKVLVDLVWQFEDSIVVVPGNKGRIRTFHNCFAVNGRIHGIHGVRRNSPIIEFTVESTAAPLSVPAQTRGQDEVKIPSLTEFMGCRSESDFSKLVGTEEGAPISDLKAYPQSFWIHPQTFVNYFAQSPEDTAKAAAIRVIADVKEDRKKASELHRLLIFLWAIDRGFSSGSVKMGLPCDSKDVDDASELIMQKLTSLDTMHNEDNEVMSEEDQPEDHQRPQAGTPPQGSHDGGQKQKRKNKRRKQNSRTRKDAPSSSDESSHSSRGSIETSSNESESRSENSQTRHKRERNSGRKRRERRTPSSVTHSSSSEEHSSSSSASDGPRSSRRRSSRSRRHYRRRDSSGSSSDSSTRFRSHRRRKKSKRRSKKRTRSREIESAFLQTSQALLASTQKFYDRENQRKSVLGRLTVPQRTLFDVLCATSWKDKRPKMSKDARLLVDDRDPQKLINMVHDWTESWTGSVAEDGVIKFLTTGYMSREQPGGFTLFMFGPIKLTPLTKKERERKISSALGKSDPSNEQIKEFAKQNFFLPPDVDNAETQLKTGVRFLEKMTARHGIASKGYRHGLKFLQSNRRDFLKAIEGDNMFMVKYAYMLDSIFQSFLRALSQYLGSRSPIPKARRELQHYMEDAISDTMRGFSHNLTPNLTLPTALTMIDSDSDAQGPPLKKKVKSEPPGDSPPNWWSKNPRPAKQWKIPEGKQFADFFGTKSAHGKENLARLPSAPHHKDRAESRQLCARYQTVGKCSNNCHMTHIKPVKMSSELREATSAAISAAYANQTNST